MRWASVCSAVNHTPFMITNKEKKQEQINKRYKLSLPYQTVYIQDNANFFLPRTAELGISQLSLWKTPRSVAQLSFLQLPIG